VPNTCERPRLSFRRLNLSSTLCFRAPTAAIVSKVTRRHVLAAFYAAALAYSAITTSALVVGMYSLHHYHTDVLVALTYLLQWPNLIVVLWLTGIPLRTKISVLGIYFGLGLLLTTFASSVYHAALLAEAMVSFIVFFSISRRDSVAHPQVATMASSYGRSYSFPFPRYHSLGASQGEYEHTPSGILVLGSRNRLRGSRCFCCGMDVET